MIVPMKKITLLALEKDREEMLLKMKKKGVLHVEKMNATGENLAKLLSSERDLSFVKNLLIEFVPKKVKTTDGQNEPSIMSYDETLIFVSNVLSLHEGHKEDIVKSGKIIDELSRCEIWGDFNLKDLDFLKEKGIKLIPLTMSIKAFTCE